MGQGADLLAELAGPPRQVAHLVGHHGKAAPRLAGTRGLDRRVQSEQIGLLGDGADFGEDVLHVLGAARDVVGDFDQFQRQLAVADDAIDHPLHGAGRVLHEFIEIDRRLFLIATCHRQAQAALHLGLRVHTLKTVGQALDGFGEQELNPGHFVAHGGVLAGELAHAFVQQLGEFAQQLALGIPAHIGLGALLLQGQEGDDHPTRRHHQQRDDAARRQHQLQSGAGEHRPGQAEQQAFSR